MNKNIAAIMPASITKPEGPIAMCFSLGWIEQLCIWLIVVCAIVAIIRLLVPFLTSMIGVPIIGQIINIVLWAVVAIMCVYIIFALISCLLGAGGGLAHFPR